MLDRRDADETATNRGANAQLQFTITPSDRTVSGRSNQTFSEALTRNELVHPTDCGLLGTCGKCRIRFLSPAPEPSSAGVRLLPAEDLSTGWRLACQQPVIANAVIEIAGSDDHPPATSEDTNALRAATINPGIEQLEILLKSESSQGREQALCLALGDDCVYSSEAKRAFAEQPLVQESVFTVVKRGRQILDLRSGKVRGEVLGLAIDIGTTTLAVHLFDLSNGVMRASETSFNPQRAVGADVISRIGYVRKHAQAGLRSLQTEVVDGLNTLVDRACESSHATTDSIYRAVIVGNPTMLHLLAGISPVGIDHSPYTAAFLNSLIVAPGEIGLHAHGAAEVLLLPGISSYVGADIVAGLVATSLGSGGKTELLVDVGTNGEIVLATNGRLVACSTAAGPAFEGASIRDGIIAVPGAIEDVVIDAGLVQCSTIGGLPPKGLCGTGLISAVHELLKVGIIDSTGKLNRGRGALSEQCAGEGRDAHFLLGDSTSPVALYQDDIRAFQLGKAAIRAGIDTLLHFVGVSAEKLDRIYVAGAFGTHLQPERALGTGLLPMVKRERIQAIGNTAGQGAVIVLLDSRRQVDAEVLAGRVESIELASSPEFSERFLDRMSFREV